MLKIGDKVPEFSLLNQDNIKVSLSSFFGKWLVLYFYPKDNTPGCSIEGIEFTGLIKEFSAMNSVVVGVSADSVKSHCNFIEKKNLGIMLLSDESKEMIKSYGVYGEKKFMGKTYMGINRTTFLVDFGGKIVFVWKNVKAKAHAAAVLEKVKELVL